MIWWILGVLVALVVGFLVFLQVKFAMHEKFVRENGQPVLGVLLMANETLYDPNGDPETPGFAVIGFEKPTPDYLAAMREVAARLAELDALGEAPEFSAVEREFAASLKNVNHTQGRRRRVPDEVTRGESFYLVDLWIYRERLPEDWLEQRVLACMATGRDEGEVLHIGADEEEAASMFAAAGLV